MGSIISSLGSLASGVGGAVSNVILASNDPSAYAYASNPSAYAYSPYLAPGATSGILGGSGLMLILIVGAGYLLLRKK